MFFRKQTIDAALRALQDTTDVMPLHDPNAPLPSPVAVKAAVLAKFDELKLKAMLKRASPGAKPDYAASVLLSLLADSYDSQSQPITASWCRAAAEKLKTST